MNRLKIIIVCLVACAFNMAARTYSVQEIPNVHLLDSTQFVSNPDGILSPAAVASLNNDIRREWRETSVEFVIVAVDNIDSDDPVDFATQLFTNWGVGKRDKDNGLLMLVVKDQRAVEIRAGYGVEGVLPDITIGGIVRNSMIPLFRKDDYDGAVMAGTREIIRVLEDPQYADELRSKYANNQSNSDEDESILEVLGIYASIMALGAIILLLYFYYIYSKGKEHPNETYEVLKKMKVPALMFTALGLGVPLIAYLPLNKMMQDLRNKPRKCTRCGSEMQKLDEVRDNYYLNPGQNTEEMLNSVDYDVWLCPECGETEVIAYPNEASIYKPCPKCGTKAYAMQSDRVVVQPTTTSEGLGVRTSYCRHCGYHHDDQYKIPKKVDEAALIAGAGLALGSRGRGGFGGGGFGGGSFGGGLTGGGGAGGRW